MEEKICPIITTGRRAEESLLDEDCQKDKCAFWNESECAILSIGKALKVAIKKD